MVKNDEQNKKEAFEALTEVCEIVGMNPPSTRTSTVRMKSKLNKAFEMLKLSDFKADQDFTKSHVGLHPDSVRFLVKEELCIPPLWEKSLKYLDKKDGGESTADISNCALVCEKCSHRHEVITSSMIDDKRPSMETGKSAEAPEMSQKEIKAKAKAKTHPKSDKGPSKCLRLYREWVKDPNRTFEELNEAIDNVLSIGTIRTSVSGWRHGHRLPKGYNK